MQHMEKSESLTIIVPVYNEEESLDQFRIEMDKFLNKTPIKTYVLFVNDGSTDKSAKIIENICDKYDSYRTLSLDKNYGLSTAIKAGIDNCKSSLIGYIDSDIQTSPLDFLNYFEYFPQYDMVNGIRAKRNDSVIKRFSSKFANSFRRMMINDNITDTCCPLKIIKTEKAKNIPFFTGMHRFIPALIQLQGGKVKQIPVSHYPRYAGTAKYHLFNRLSGPFFDTLVYRWMKKRYIRYRINDINK